jgi:hypothetical protein
MNATGPRAGLGRRLVPRCAAAGRGERLTNWLALIMLLVLGIVWQ